MALNSALAYLSFDAVSLTIHRGSYSGAFCIKPASGNFAGDATFSVVEAAFKSYPATLSAY